MKSRIRERWAHQETAFCLTLDFPSSSSAEFLGRLGFDALAVDLEHGHPGWGVLEDIARSCALVGVDLVARLPVDVDLIARCLDLGVRGLQLTHVDSVAEVESALECIRFAPQGVRGLGRSRATNFGHYPGGYPSFIRDQKGPVLIVHIESGMGIEALPEILTSEIDVIVIGAYDLSNDLGVAGQTDHPEVLAAVDRIVGQVEHADKVLGLSASTASVAAAAITRGSRFLLASEARLLSTAANELRAVARNNEGNP